MKLCSLILLLTSSLLASCVEWDKGRPSDAELAENFRVHEAEFNKLISMSNEDAKVVRIYYDRTLLENNRAWPRAESELGFSKQRWDEYRSLFKSTGLDWGLVRATDIAWKDAATEGTIFLIASAGGMVTGASEKGYAYSPKEPSPIVESLDHINIKIKDMVPIYKRLKGNWYLFYREGG